MCSIKTPILPVPSLLDFADRHIIEMISINAMTSYVHVYIFLYIYIYIHCSPVVWNHISSASVLLCLNGVKFFKQHPSLQIFKHIENMFVYMNMFPMCLKNRMAWCCLKKMVPFKHNKTVALLGWFHTIGAQCILLFRNVDNVTECRTGVAVCLIHNKMMTYTKPILHMQCCQNLNWLWSGGEFRSLESKCFSIQESPLHNYFANFLAFVIKPGLLAMNR